MMEIASILMCIPLYVLNSFCDKYISTQNSKAINILYNIIKFAVGAVFLLPAFCRDSAKLECGILICGMICGIMYAVSKIIILTGYEKSSVAFMTVCHSSGMLLPCVLGHFLWDEKLTLAAFGGIILVIISILLLKDTNEKKDNNLISIFIGIIVIVTSGGVMILQKIMGIYFSGVGVSAFNFYSFASAFLILNCIPKNKTENVPRFGKIFLCAIGSAFSLCIISMVMTQIASTVPSIIMFPLFNGSGIIIVTLLSAVIYKEKITLKRCIGIFVGLVGLFLNNM